LVMKPINPKASCDEAIRIQERLTATGQTWADLGAAADVSDQNLYYWRKKGVPKLYLATVASFLNCSVDWLLTGQTENMNESGDKEYLQFLIEQNQLA